MDATSIITQVSRDDEQLGTYGPEKGKTTKKVGDCPKIVVLVFNQLIMDLLI